MKYGIKECQDINLSLTHKEYEVLCHYVRMSLLENIENKCEYNILPLSRIKDKLDQVRFCVELND